MILCWCLYWHTLWYVLLDVSSYAVWVERQNSCLIENRSLNNHESSLNHDPEAANQIGCTLLFYLPGFLSFCMPTLRMAHCVFSLQFSLVSRTWTKWNCPLYLISNKYLWEIYSLKHPSGSGFFIIPVLVVTHFLIIYRAQLECIWFLF